MQHIFDSNSDHTRIYTIEASQPYAYSEFTDWIRHYDSARYVPPYLEKVAFQEMIQIPTPRLYSIKKVRSFERYKDFVYPMAVRYISQNNTYVIERPPFELEVDFRMGGAHSGHPKMPAVKIWIPWTVMIFKANSFVTGSFSDVQLFLNSGPIESLDDQLIPCLYPNSYSNSKICFSASLSDFNDVLDLEEFEKGNIGYIYNYIFNNYMMGGWNADLEQNLVRIRYMKNNKNYPITNLFLNPSSDKDFYSKLSSVFSKEFFSKIKRFYKEDFELNRSRISREKLYTRNFGIFSAFTLEQKINFIKEIQTYNSLNKIDGYKLSNLIEEHERRSHCETSASGVSSILKLTDSSIQYTYKSNVFDFYFVRNRTMISRHESIFQQIPPQQLALIQRQLIDFMANRSENEQIAFVYDLTDNTYEVIINYNDREFISEIYNTILAHCKERLEETQERSRFRTWFNTVDESFLARSIDHLCKPKQNIEQDVV
jgi:hypothetical protein